MSSLNLKNQPIQLIDWCGYQWMTQERWGLVHPEKSHWWYDKDRVHVDSKNVLHLRTGLNPRKFDHIEEISPISVGLVSCTEKFSYGTFEFEAKLPTGKNLWPAIWMYSWESWPPEIDILEGYSDQNDNFSYKKMWFWTKKQTKYNIHSNIHYREKNQNKSIHDIQPSHGTELAFEPTKKFVKYVCIWKPDLIQIYYDNILVRQVGDKTILSKIEGHKMNVIINNGVTSFVDKKNPPISDFQLSGFQYSPL
jgi:hypothetical protein